MKLERWLTALATMLLTVGAGCAADTSQGDEPLGSVRQAVGESIATDKASYTVGENVTLTFANLPGNFYDWVTLSPVGSPATSYTRWAYTYGAANGSTVFSGPPAGNYVARAYVDNTYTVLAESAPFTIAPQAAPVTVTTNQGAYATSATISVSFSGMAGYAADWISIAPQGSAATGFVRWAYTNGQLSGSLPFTAQGLSGTYVARAHFDNGYGIEAESAPFTVGAVGTSVTTDKGSYAYGEAVTITFSNMQGTPRDWISVAPSGSSTEDWSWWKYTAGATGGTAETTTLPPGTWVARAYFNDSYTLEAESAPFTVGAPASQPVSLSTDKASYSGLEPVRVTFSGMSGDPSDWVGAFRPTAAMDEFSAWGYTSGATAGTIDLTALYAGTFEVRAFFADGFSMQGRSASFTVSAAVTTLESTYTTGDTISVRYGGMYGSRKDWVAIAAAGSAQNLFYLYQYTDGWPAGTASFSASALGPGSYVARVFYDDELTMRAESAAFTVTP